MAILVPDVGEVLLLKYALNHTAPTNPKLHLYTNNYTPVEGSVIADFTESTATGYAEKTLTGSSFTVATVSGVTTASYAAQTFTYTAAETVYGYYITNNGNTQVLWAEKFAAAFPVPSGGGSVVVTPTITAA